MPAPFLSGWGKRKALLYGTAFPASSLTDYPKYFGIFGDTDIAAELAGGGGVAVTAADGTTVIPLGLYATAALASGDVPLRTKLSPLSSASTGDVYGYLYYDAGQTTTEDKAGVVSNGYAFFGEFGDFGGDVLLDWVSGSTYAGSGGLSTSDLTTGVVGQALEFDGVDDNIEIPSVLGAGDNTTIRCLASPASPAKGAFIKVGNASNGYGIGVGSGNYDIAGSSVIALYELQRWIPSGYSYTTGWHQFGLTVDATGYPHIVYDGTVVYSDSGTTPITPSGSIYIGGYTSSVPTWRGPAATLDGVCVEAARSADWLAYAYQDDFANADTFTLGPEETAGGGVPGGGGAVAAVARLAGAGSTDRSGSGSVGAVASLTGAGEATRSGSGGVAAVARLVGTGEAIHAGAGTVAAVGRLAGEGRTDRAGGGAVSGVGRLAGDGLAPNVGPAGGGGAVTAVARLVGAGEAVRAGAGAVTAVAGLAAVGEADHGGGGAVVGVGRLVGDGSSGTARALLGAPGIRPRVAGNPGVSLRLSSQPGIAPRLRGVPGIGAVP